MQKTDSFDLWPWIIFLADLESMGILDIVFVIVYLPNTFTKI